MSCVNTTSDPNNCGGCNNACPAVANATPTCNGGSCGFTCNAGFQACGGVCSNSVGTNCETGKLGICAAGKIACSGGSLVCAQNQQPAAETCDAVDNNCNGQVDEGNPGSGPCPRANVCELGSYVCSSAMLWCDLAGYVAAGTPCGVDLACDGAGKCCDSRLGTHGQVQILQSYRGGIQVP